MILNRVYILYHSLIKNSRSDEYEKIRIKYYVCKLLEKIKINGTYEEQFEKLMKMNVGEIIKKLEKC